jgi:hypothetical protein
VGFTGIVSYVVCSSLVCYVVGLLITYVCPLLYIFHAVNTFK